MPITLPEMTIEGSPELNPVARWFNEGYCFAWNNPGEPGQPPQVSEEFEQAYNLGYSAGQSAAAAAGQIGDGTDEPSIGPDDAQGESYEEYEARYREALEALFHEHMPHIEVEPPEIVIEFTPR